ncbi:MAG: GntR family transcriptional regulator [Chitinivibrionales bacterium]|nr:GntR family transcriptional regulator [Chitinivibrionales bacterium]
MRKAHTASLHLQTQIEQAVLENRDRLPSLTRMAAACGVSHVTMAKAVHALVARGVLSCTPGRGIRIVRPGLQPESSTDVPPARLPAWIRTAEEIRQAILDGRCPPGSWLPSVAELKAAHGVSNDTIIKALRRLADDRIVERYKRRYRVPAPRFGGSGGCVVLVCRGRINLTSIAAERYRSMVRQWDTLLAQHNIELLVAPLWYEGEQMVSFERWQRRYADALAGRIVLGFIYWNYAMATYPFAEIVHGLRRYARPLSVFADPVYAIPRLRAAAVGYPVRVFVNQHHYEAGVTVGHFCRETHARSLCYVAPAEDRWWAQERYRGLLDGIAGQQPAPAVHSFIAGNPPKQVLQSSAAFGRAVKGLSDEFSFETIRGLLPGHVGDEIGRHLTSAVHLAKAAEDMTSIVDTIATLPRPLCIVGADDERAFHIYLLLRDRAPSCIDHCTFVGFNDSETAFVHGFSSYNFNDAATAQAIVGFVLNPRNPLLKPSTAGYVSIEGYLNVRSGALSE